MISKLLAYNFLIEWEVPDAWNTQINPIIDSNWKQAIKEILLPFVVFTSLIFLLKDKEFSFLKIIFFSTSISIFIYFVERLTRWMSAPIVRIYPSFIRIKYWGGKEEVRVKKIKSYRFNRYNIKGKPISVLELHIDGEEPVEIGLPKRELEEDLISILTKELDIPFFGIKPEELN